MKLTTGEKVLIIYLIVIAILNWIPVILMYHRSEIIPQKWILINNQTKCPRCGGTYTFDPHHLEYYINYCPQCGLRLKGIKHDKK